MIGDLLQSPVLKNVLCKPTNFSFKTKSLILARINRAELGDFDALILALFLIEQSKGQVIVPDFGFYGRDVHVSLMREERISELDSPFPSSRFTQEASHALHSFRRCRGPRKYRGHCKDAWPQGQTKWTAVAL